MRWIWAFLFVGILGCARPQHMTTTQDDSRFHAFADEYLSAYLEWRPQEGTSLGLHQYDGRLTDFRAESIRRERARLLKVRKELLRFQQDRLSPQVLYELRLLNRANDRELFQFEDLQVFHRNPMVYASTANVDIYIKREFAPLEQRLRSLQGIFQAVPAMLQNARINLEERLPKPHVETAIEMAEAAGDFWEKELEGAITQVASPELQAARQQAVKEMRGYAKWLREERLPLATQDFALGRKKYQKMLETGEMISMTPEELLELGRNELRKTQRQFAEVARRIDPTKPAEEVYKSIQKEHPTAANLIPETAKNLEAIRQFLLDRRIVTIPSDVRVKVQETPGFMRAVSFASMDTPGPFETEATEAYYYVTPVEPHWPEAQKEEWLTAFNYYTTDIVSIHEAYPGHYVQFLCLNASPVSKLAKVFWSYAFTEGWAHYTEQMMIEEGFGAGPNAAKYHLAQLGEALLRLCRMCVSLKMHCEGMSVEEGTAFFQRECYYERKPAFSEAKRGAYDPEYLYYTVGKLQVLKLRDDWKAQEGAGFSLQDFHDQLLKHGAPPVRLLRERMLSDSAGWEKTL